MPRSTDLATVDDLCRLAVAAGRLGCRIHLDGADPELWSLLDLAGVTGVLHPCPADPAVARDTSDAGDLR